MVALMFATATGMASEPKLSVSSNADGKSFVYELDASSGETTIKLRDAENHVIYSESIFTGSFTKKFDMKNLSDGLYYFTSENDLKTVSYTLQVEGEIMTMLKRRENAKPVFRKADGMVYLNLLNLNKKDVKIEIYDSNDRLVFSEKRENEMIIEKALNFKQAFKDRYAVVVKDSENTYYESIVVR